METEAVQTPEMKKQGKAATYIRWAITILGAAIILMTFVMAIYRKFGG
jgi:hypothetical protein